MAFRHPAQPPQALRIQDDRIPDAAAAAPTIPALVEPQTRIIFSPTTDITTTTASSSQESASTPGRSRLSDLGSFHSVIVKSTGTHDGDSRIISATYSEVIEDDAELDSLDSHLSEFRAAAVTVPAGPHRQDAEPVHHQAPVFPNHDGLGSFNIDHPAAAAKVQEQLYAFEQFNPRRIRRRRESLEVAVQHRELENDEARDLDAKMRRIEVWRMEQSRYLLAEIEKETRRRGILPGSESQFQVRGEAGSLRGHHDALSIPATDAGISDWHEHDDPTGSKRKQSTWTETIKTVIRELIGIDEKVLAILFGEEAGDAQAMVASVDGDNMSVTPKASVLDTTASQGVNSVISILKPDHSWQDRVIARIARELGLLVHKLSDHPGAFSTYVRMKEMPLPYAGLAVIPETTATDSHQQRQIQEQPPQQSPSENSAENKSIGAIKFTPTIQQASVTQPIAIPSSSHKNDGQAPSSSSQAGGAEEGGATFTQKEWEQELDVKMVFKYLRSRFTSGPSPESSSPPVVSASAVSVAATSTSHVPGRFSPQDTAAKAARVRMHHPLVSRGTLTRPLGERRTFKATTGSSCASQSTRRRGSRNGNGNGTGSSKHYWDIGHGSLGTGSLVGSTGRGGWGDV